MDKQTILKLAIAKAVRNEYKLPYVVELQLEMRNMEALVRYHQIDPANCMDDRWSVMSLNGIIFDKDFARAFWGDKLVAVITTDLGEEEKYVDTRRAWQYHLQQMVLEADPLEYLSKFI